MTDPQVRGSLRIAQSWDSPVSTLEARMAHKRAGGSAGLDLTLPRDYVVPLDYRTYGGGVAQLRNTCEGNALQPYHNGLARPLTFAENLRARLADTTAYLWHTSLNSCTGVLYKDNSGGGPVTFKIIQISEDLLHLPEAFKGQYWPLPFDSIETDEIFQVDPQQTPSMVAQFRNHGPWLAAAGYDQKLLDDYAECAEAIGYFPNNFMEFWTAQRPMQDQLRPLLINSTPTSTAHAEFHFNNGQFARVTSPGEK